MAASMGEGGGGGRAAAMGAGPGPGEAVLLPALGPEQFLPAERSPAARSR